MCGMKLAKAKHSKSLSLFSIALSDLLIKEKVHRFFQLGAASSELRREQHPRDPVRGGGGEIVPHTTEKRLIVNMP